MARLFGTDGVRGRANGDITAELAVELSVGAAHVLGTLGAFGGTRPRAIVARDTRPSGDFLSAAVCAGLAAAGVGLEVCPGSNISLGVYGDPDEVPLRALADAGIAVALGADDPLLFGSRLVDQYVNARDDLGYSDAELADLARGSIRISRAPADLKRDTLAGIDAWLADAPA